MTEKADNKTALVTGGGKGIGRAIALALADQGMTVYINYRSGEADARTTLDDILARGGQGEVTGFDVTDQAACEDAVKQIVKTSGSLDVLVNNAGIRDDRLFAMMKTESWCRVVDTSLTGFYHLTKPAIKQMLRKRYGRIISITSAAGQMGNAGQVNYSAAKAGLIGATKALAREVGPRGITVNAVAPGFIDTGMLEGLDTEQLLASIPAGRLGKPEEVASVVAFLCSDGAAYVNGQVIGVNGGMV